MARLLTWLFGSRKHEAANRSKTDTRAEPGRETAALLDDLEIVALVQDRIARGYLCSCVVRAVSSGGEELPEPLLRKAVTRALEEVARTYDLKSLVGTELPAECQRMAAAYLSFLPTHPEVLRMRLVSVTSFEKQVEKLRVVLDFRRRLQRAYHEQELAEMLRAREEQQLLQVLNDAGEDDVRALLLNQQQRSRPPSERVVAYLNRLEIQEALDGLSRELRELGNRLIVTPERRTLLANCFTAGFSMVGAWAVFQRSASPSWAAAPAATLKESSEVLLGRLKVRLPLGWEGMDEKDFFDLVDRINTSVTQLVGSAAGAAYRLGVFLVCVVRYSGSDRRWAAGQCRKAANGLGLPDRHTQMILDVCDRIERDPAGPSASESFDEVRKIIEGET